MDLAGHLEARLDDAAAGRPPDHDRLALSWRMAWRPGLAPYLGLPVELAEAAARLAATERRIAARIGQAFVASTSGHLAAPEAERRALAARPLATVDGLHVLGAAGRMAEADAAAMGG